MNFSVTSLKVALALMMTPAFCYMVMFILILRSGKDQLILIMVTSAISFYAGMASTSSTMMTGKDFFHSEDDPSDVPAPSKVTRKTETVVETPPETTLNPTPIKGASA